MSHQNPCCRQCEPFPAHVDPEDRGCCTPMPVRITCDAPVVPSPECDEAEPVMVYDPETETFSVWSILYDQNCSPISDENDSPILTKIS